MALLLCRDLIYEILYTRFNRFQHCAINKDERDKPMSRTGREAQAQHNDTTQETELTVLKHCAMIKEEKNKLMMRTNRRAQAQHNDTTQERHGILYKKDICKCKTCFKWLFYCAI